MIIKALVIPMFTFVASACVVPDKYRKEIESKCFSYHLMPSILSLLCLSFPTQIPPVLFLFINNPEKDPKVSISLNANFILFLGKTKFNYSWENYDY
jgi:hypothetical protein